MPGDMKTGVVPVKKSLQIGGLVIGKDMGERQPMYQPFSRLTAHRPIIYSGSSSGFFENRDVLSYVSSIERVAKVAIVPHVTVVKVGLMDWIADAHPDLSPAELAGELRECTDGLPVRQYGHIGMASTDGPHVQLRLDSVGANRLNGDFVAIRKYFGVPDGEYVGRYVPHITLAIAPNEAVATEIVAELNAFIKPEEGETNMPVAFGDVTVLNGKN